MRGVLVLLAFIAFSFAQNIVEKYELYRNFLDAKDISLGKKLLERYPDAPFRNELILRLAELIYRENPQEARKLLDQIDLEKLPPSRQKKSFRTLG